MSEPDLQRRLAAFFRSKIPDGKALEVCELEQSTEGFSQETFQVVLELTLGGARERRRYVVKREPEAGLLEPYDLLPEFRVLNALSDSAIPSPPTPWFESDPRVLVRSFYVMEHLPGQVPLPTPGPTGEGPFDAAQRACLGPVVARTLADIHAVDWREHAFEFLGVPEVGTGAARAALASWERRIERSGLALPPVLAEALHWLRGNLPACSEVTLVHGDYRLGNWLVEMRPGEARLSGVLDWELVHLGDPLEDLAWISSPLWRGQTPWAGAVLPPEELAAIYAEAAGREVDPERLRFYAVLSIVKMIAIQLTGIRAFRDGRTGDLKLAIFDHMLPALLALLAALRGHLPVPIPGGLGY